MVELHEPVSERIGKILRENREAQGLTRQQLSEKSTVSDRQISAIELGEKGPSMNSLELLLRSRGYGGFPASTCISVNEVIIHGIPGNRVLKEGDIVSVDVGATWGGFTGDCAATFACGAISPTAQKLITVTEQSFYEGIKFARQGNRISDIGHAVQTYVESHGFGVVRAFVGHGVGEKMHEEPEVPNYGSPGRGPRMVKGMTLAIEPMVTQGSYDVRVLKDGWTTVTADGKLAAHYENSILITDGEPEILTVTEGL